LRDKYKSNTVAVIKQVLLLLLLLQPFARKDFFMMLNIIMTMYWENLQTLHIRRRHFDAVFLINVFSGTKQCQSVLETVGIRVPTRNIRNFNTFSCSLSHCPSARCVSAANAVCKYTDIFSKSYLSVKSLR
jgi:hypothetical protein